MLHEIRDFDVFYLLLNPELARVSELKELCLRLAISV